MYNLTLEASYPTPYAASQFLSMILLSMAGQKHTPDTTVDIKDAYDYVIVGAGSAGSIVASRLAEEKCVSILLLEAGKSPPKITDLPVACRSLLKTDLDWQYYTVPQKDAGNDLIDRRVYFPSGKAVGGGGVINVMMGVRGNRKNYDDWAAKGATGWDYDSVLPYFKKMENNTNEDYVKNGYHGTSGPIYMSNLPYESELRNAILEDAKEKGYFIGDTNGPKQSGFYDLQTTIKNGQRCSAAKAYLVPVENQDNIDIVSEAFVKKIIVDKKEARGVVFDFQGKERKVKALKEVILSAGSVNTAQILMLSGIGPEKELEKHKIKVLKDLPVGKNLQDHFAAIFPFEYEAKPFFEKIMDEENINAYINSKTGALASPAAVGTIAFLKSDGREASDNYPDVQLYFIEGAAQAMHDFNIVPELYKSYYETYESKNMHMCIAQVLHPKGTGEVTLKSSNPFDPPLIDPKYFSHPHDLDVVAKGLRLCKEFGLSKSMQKIGSKLLNNTYPGCEHFSIDDDEFYRCMAKSVVVSISHPVGTAKMGNPKDPSTVVDPELRVKGIRNLRVIDASVMPTIPGGNTNLPTMMVAEKGAHIIKKSIKCDTKPKQEL